MHTNSLSPGLIHSECRHMTSTVMMVRTSWTNRNVGKATHQQCSNNLLPDHSARLHAYHVPLRAGSANRWLAKDTQIHWGNVPVVFRLWSHKLCKMDASLLERYGTSSTDPSDCPWGFHGREVRSIQSQTPRIVLNIQNHQLLNRISSSSSSKLCATLPLKVKLSTIQGDRPGVYYLRYGRRYGPWDCP